MQTKGFVYDNKTGLYYDTENGLYYDQLRKLYFDNENGIYYNYIFNKYTNKYNLRFHSRISSKKWKKMCELKNKKDSDLDINEELNVKDESSTDDESDELDSIFVNLKDQNEMSKYPPCIRAILTKSNSENFQPGSLFIIPYTGGFMGNSSKSDSETKPFFVIDFKNEIDIDEMIAKIEYDLNEKSYFINVIKFQEFFLNDKKINLNEKEKLNHGDQIDFNKFQLLIHIHSGMNSCAKCEPGEIMNKIKIEKENLNKAISNMNIKSKQEIRKEKVKLIKNKYGLKWNNTEYLSNKYKDRAKKRRDECGIDYTHLNKNTVSSTENKVDADNIGRKLLEKMGWKEGSGLGKHQTGIVEPINPKLKLNKAGLGAEKNELNMDTDEVNKKKLFVWKKTMQRLEQSNNALFNTMENDSDDQ